MKLIYFFPLLFLTFSCAENGVSDEINTIPNSQNDTIESIIDTIKPTEKIQAEKKSAPTINYDSPAQQFLANHFKPFFVEDFNKLDNKIYSITSSEELKSYENELEDFINQFRIHSILKDKREAIFMNYYEFVDSFNVIKPACFEECTFFGFTINKEALVSLSKEVGNEHDIEYLELLTLSEKDLSSVNQEEGQMSILGNNKSLKFLQNTFKAVQEDDINTEKIKLLRLNYINAMKMEMYENNTFDVLKEVDEIYAQNSLLKNEKKLVKAAKEYINSCKGCQFDCIEGGCTW